jgi:hypothetical protein
MLDLKFPCRDSQRFFIQKLIVITPSLLSHTLSLPTFFLPSSSPPSILPPSTPSLFPSRPDTHALGNEYGQKTAADVLLLGGRLVLNVSSDFAAKSPYFTKPGPLDKLKA